MILSPAELISIIPRREKSGRTVDDYWRPWMAALPLSGTRGSEGWQKQAKRLKKYWRDAENKELHTTPAADGIMLQVIADICSRFGVELQELPTPANDAACVKWSDAVSLCCELHGDEFSLRQAQLIRYYEGLQNLVSERHEEGMKQALNSLENYVPLSQDIARLSKYEIAKKDAAGKILRLLCTVDLLLHDPVIAMGSAKAKNREFILQALPFVEDVKGKGNTPEARFVDILMQRVRSGAFASAWKGLDPNLVNKLNAWIRGRQHPRQEGLLALLIAITDSARDQIMDEPKLMGWEDHRPEDLREEAEEATELEFLFLYKLLELTILLDAIFCQLAKYAGTRSAALQLLIEQVQFSLRRIT